MLAFSILGGLTRAKLPSQRCCSTMKRSRPATRYALRARSSAIPAVLEKNDSDSESEASSNHGDDDAFIPDDRVSSASEPSEISEVDNELSEIINSPPTKARRKSLNTRTPQPSCKIDNAIDWNKTEDERTSLTTISETAARGIQKTLLRWYFRNARELPWRVPPHDPDAPLQPSQQPSSECAPGAPYAIWVSEIMSQQTRIEVAARYWRRWMEALPNIASLVAAPPERVRELWAGLGYYRRAALLQRAANQVVDKHGGELPRTVKKLLELSGIGAYTAGAIASIAFGAREPAIDGNVARVLARLRPAIAELSGKPLERAQHTAASAILAPPGNPADINQGLMELGATICLPRGAARCGVCPLQEYCGAFQRAETLGIEPAVLAEQLPPPAARKKVKVRTETVAVAVMATKKSDGWYFLIRQRGDDGGLLAGFWEPPARVFKGSPKLPQNVFADVAAECGKAEDIKWKSADEVTHIFSHIRQRLLVKVAVVDDEIILRDGAKWMHAQKVPNMAVSTQMIKVFKSAGAQLGITIARKV